MYEIDQVIPELTRFLPLEIWFMIRRYEFRNVVEYLEKELKMPIFAEPNDVFILTCFKIELNEMMEVVVDSYFNNTTVITYNWDDRKVYEYWMWSSWEPRG